MQVIFLGTNGWYDTDTGNTICILLKSRKFNIIFDAGIGFYKTDVYAKKTNQTFLFLSHFHFDHIMGLHILNKMKSMKEIIIFGPKGTKKILKNFLSAPYTMPVERLPLKVKFYEIPKNQKQLPFSLEAKPLLHSSLTLGYRITLDGKTIAYCPDTGYCKNAVDLSRQADLLIAECAYKSGQRLNQWPHLNPESAARIAKEAGVKKLVLVHFDAHFYRTIHEREKAAQNAKKIFKNTVAAMDDMHIKI